MSLTTAIPLAWAILPDKDLVALILLDYGRYDRCAGNSRLAHLDVITVRYKQDIVQNDLLTDFARQLLNAEKVPSFGAVLPTATFYNCVHSNLQKEPAYRDAGSDVGVLVVSGDQYNDHLL